MRVPIAQYLLAVLAISAGLSDANPLLRDTKMQFERRATNGTEGYTEQEIKDGLTGGAASRGIDWKIVKGGLSKMREPLNAVTGCVSAVFAVMAFVQLSSNRNSCDPLQGSQYSDDGAQGINYYYYSSTTGSNCDTTAQAKTIADAVADAWDGIHDKEFDHACIDLSHGGTWTGHLAIATKKSGIDVSTFCPA
ncbi:uncharacterized protein BDV14DRAFT_203643 [Aspergillus stella-maris]|uniref:uncharacterized protein n=1 Tax=Aspergillus stella-maris TaxID=1810926 RepID=UPI003CCDEA8B